MLKSLGCKTDAVCTHVRIPGRQFQDPPQESLSCMNWPPQSPGLNLTESLGCAGGDFTEWFDSPIFNTRYRRKK